MLRASIFVVLASVAGCYLSHERGASDAGPLGPRDAPRDVPDAPPPRCERLVVASTALLDGPGGVTPRLVALDGGEVGIVYVSPGGGDPTLVLYERLGPGLERRTGPVRVATDSWTWAELARVDGGLVVAFGSTAGAPSVLVPIDLSGSTRGPRSFVAAAHPEHLRATAAGIFWLAFESGDENAFAMTHIRSDGTLLHPIVRLGLGRYGSGFGVAARPSGHGHLLTYPSEGPPGTRRPRLNAIADDGTLEGEQLLADASADAALVTFAGEMPVVLWRRRDAIVVSRRERASLAPAGDIETFPHLSGTLFFGGIGTRLVFGTFESGRVRIVDGSERGPAIELDTPRPGFGGSLSWVSVPGALVVAGGLTEIAEAYPWVVRIECVPR